MKRHVTKIGEKGISPDYKKYSADKHTTHDLHATSDAVSRDLFALDLSSQTNIHKSGDRRQSLSIIDRSGKGKTSGLQILLLVEECSREEVGSLAVKASDLIGNSWLLHLSGFWAQTKLDKGNKVRLLQIDADECKQRTVNFTDTSTSLLIFESQTFITATQLVSSIFCLRKTVINERIKIADLPISPAMLIGSIAHHLFQTAIVERLHEKSELVDLMVGQLNTFAIADSLYLHDLALNDCIEKMQPYVDSIGGWLKRYALEQNWISDKGSNKEFQVQGVSDIEESIWCSDLGLRGKIDVSLLVNVKEKRSTYSNENQFQSLLNNELPSLMPLELKTGKSTFGADHIAQLTVYTAMMSNVYKKKVNSGLLLYLKDGSMQVVENGERNLQSLLQLRNQLAYFLSIMISNEGVFPLPEPLNNRRICETCPQLLSCCLLQKMQSGADDFSYNSAMREIVPTRLQHLKSNHINWCYKWMRWLSMEWDTLLKKRSSDASNRNVNTSVNDLILCDSTSVNEIILLVFERKDKMPISGSFAIGEFVRISNVSKNRWGISNGTVNSLNECLITIQCDRLITKSDQNDQFRLDRQISYVSMEICMGNVIKLMDTTAISNRLRSFLIDKCRSNFLEKLPSSWVTKGRSILKTLNRQQVRTCVRALMAEDYLLVQGMPGCGKTTAIVALLRLCVAVLNLRVLVCAHTHSAIDNILLKYKTSTDFASERVLRLGSSSQIHPDCRSLEISNRLKDAIAGSSNITQAYKDIVDSAAVVFCTCYQAATNSIVIKQPQFDICIIDEASLLQVSACLGSLRASKKWFLVGDPQQLRPLVQNKQAHAEGMCESIFELLSSIGTDSVVKLSIQYRMNAELCKLSNTLIYNGALQCANESVANATIPRCWLSSPSGHQNITDLPDWMLKVASTEIGDSALFLNTANLPDNCCKFDGPGLPRNECEAAVIAKIFGALCCKTPEPLLLPSDIGIICLYRNQLGCVRRALLAEVASTEQHQLPEIGTADAFQGKDFSCVLVSLVSSVSVDAAATAAGMYLLDDMRRLNVILTRAKHKLVLIGNLGVVSTFENMQKLLALFNKSQIVNL